MSLVPAPPEACTAYIFTLSELLVKTSVGVPSSTSVRPVVPRTLFMGLAAMLAKLTSWTTSLFTPG